MDMAYKTVASFEESVESYDESVESFDESANLSIQRVGPFQILLRMPQR